MKIWISNRQRKTAISPEKIRKKAGKILSALGWSEAILSLTLLGDQAMARLNRETFGRRGPTNVIAFPLDEMMPGGGGRGPKTFAPTPNLPPPIPKVKIPAPPKVVPGGPESLGPPNPPLLLGEVVISVETTRRQAREYGWPWKQLFDFFLIHGILHLMGYTHGTPGEEEAMTAKTWELMRLLHPKLVAGH